MPRIPAMNEIRVQSGSEEPKYPDEPEDKRYLVLYPDDYQGHGVDIAGNVAILVNEENAREIKRLAEGILSELEDNNE